MMEQNLEDKSTCSQVASLVSRFLSQESKRARTTTVISGQRCFESFGKYVQLGSLAKMLLESSTWHSNKCALTWKPNVMKSNRLLFQLAPSMLPTEEIGCGLLPTPQAQMAGEKIVSNLRTKIGEQARIGERAYNPNTGKHTQITLNRAIQMLPTPTACEWKGRGPNSKQQGLAEAVKMLPTPLAQDSYDRINWKTIEKANLGDGASLTLSRKIKYVGKKTGMKLQPAFVEWMMGYPIGWTELKPSEMPSSRKSRSRLSKI